MGFRVSKRKFHLILSHSILARYEVVHSVNDGFDVHRQPLSSGQEGLKGFFSKSLRPKVEELDKVIAPCNQVHTARPPSSLAKLEGEPCLPSVSEGGAESSPLLSLFSPLSLALLGMAVSNSALCNLSQS